MNKGRITELPVGFWLDESWTVTARRGDVSAITSGEENRTDVYVCDNRVSLEWKSASAVCSVWQGSPLFRISLVR